MLDKYKKNFILLNMLLIGMVLFLMLAVIFFYLYHTSISDLKMTMSQLTRPVENSRNDPQIPLEAFQDQEKPLDEPDGAKPGADSPNSPDSPDNPDNPDSPDNPNSPDSSENQPVPMPPRESGPKKDDKEQEKAISIFFYHAGSGELSLLSRSFVSDEEELLAIAEKISASPDVFGQLSENKLYYYKTQTGQIFRIAVADSSFIVHSAIKTFMILLLIFLCAMLFFYLVSIRFSEYAVRPLAAEMKREKQFVADTSHDLKTPIAVILANTGILRRNQGAYVKDMMQWIDGTQTAAKNMQHLIEEMLVLSDVEAAGNKIEMKTVDLSDAAEMVSLLLEPVAYEKNVRYQADISPDIYVKGNGDYIKRIFQAFIENAIKYEPAGGEVAISLSQQHGRAVFSVNNKLSVISAEDLPCIFERFYRSDKSRQSNGSHGLGLAIVKSMADVMGARVQAESSERAGTTFCVAFALERLPG